MGRPLISIIIPTRNRQLYAEKTIRQIYQLDCDIQIVIQDNSDDESLKDLISDIIDASTVRYNYWSKPVPFSKNYDRAVTWAEGKYICAIGDDDGVLPSIINCAKWMEQNDIDVVKPAKDLVYCYPGNRNKKLNACVGFNNYSGGYRLSNPEANLIALLNSGGCNYLDLDLPGSYHGLVKKETMDTIRSITGVYYGGLTPDMYSVTCLCLVPNISFAVVDYPITLPGVCPFSGSAASETGRHVGKLEDAPHLRLLPNYQWDKRIPRYYSVETIWAETMLKAICEMNREELIERYFNVYSLAQHMYSNNLQRRDEILNVLEPELKKYVMNTYRDISKLERQYKGVNKAVLRLMQKRRVYRHVNSIEQAVQIVVRYLEKSDCITPWAD